MAAAFASTWRDLHEDLCKRTGDPKAAFEVLFLIDDFVGSGKTLLRFEEGEWKGKLKKLAQSYACRRRMFTEDCLIAIHYYIGTEQAKTTISMHLEKARQPSGPKIFLAETEITVRAQTVKKFPLEN